MNTAVEQVILGIETSLVPDRPAAPTGGMMEGGMFPLPSGLQNDEIVPIEVPLPREPQEREAQEREYVQPEAPEIRQAKEAAKAQTTPSSLRALGPVLGRAMPGAEKIRVHKRMPNGNTAFVGEYSPAELGNLDMESFLAKFVQPKLGGGVYILTGITGKGTFLAGGDVTLLDPPVEREQDSMASILRDALQRQEQQQKEMLKMFNQPQVPQQNPVSTLKDLMGVQREMSEQNKSENQGGIGAMIQAMTAQSSNSLNAMMAMMQQQAQQAQAQAAAQAAQAQQQMQMMMTLMSQPKTDPILLALIQQMGEKKRDESSVVMPPPPPAADPMDMMEKTLRLMKELNPPSEDKLSIRDIIELVRAPQAGSGSSDFQETMSNAKELMSIAHSLKQSQEPGASAGFWDALGSLFGNKELIGSVASQVRARTGVVASPQQSQLPPQVTEAFQRLQGQLQQQSVVIRQLQQENAQARAVQATPVVQTQVIESTPTVQPTPVVASAPIEEQAPIVVAPAPVPAAQIPEIPQDLLDRINLIEGAFREDDETAMVEEIIGLFVTLKGLGGFWEQLSKALMDAVESEDKARAIEYVSAFFGSLNRIGVLIEGVNDKILSLVDEHFDLIVEELTEEEG